MKKFLLIFLSLCLIFLSACQYVSDDIPFSIHFLSIGKADCILIEIQDTCIMIDTGEEENLPEILAYLEQRNIKEIDTLILSHFDKDHVGGAAGILQNVTVKNILESSFSSDREEYVKYKEECAKQSINTLVLKEEYQFTVSDCAFTVIPPEKDSYDRKQDNNASMIVTMKHGTNRYGFFGDAIEERIEEYLASHDEKFDLVKLPYHGNYLDNYPTFLDRIKPDYAVITCSEKNPPDEKTIALLKENNVRYYLTQNGRVFVMGSKKGFSVGQS